MLVPEPVPSAVVNVMSRMWRSLPELIACACAAIAFVAVVASLGFTTVAIRARRGRVSLQLGRAALCPRRRVRALRRAKRHSAVRLRRRVHRDPGPGAQPCEPRARFGDRCGPNSTVLAPLRPGPIKFEGSYQSNFRNLLYKLKGLRSQGFLLAPARQRRGHHCCWKDVVLDAGNSPI